MNRALRNPSVRTPARDLLQPLSAGSRAGDPRPEAPRDAEPGTQHCGSIWGGTSSTSGLRPRVLAVGGLRSDGQGDGDRGAPLTRQPPRPPDLCSGGRSNPPEFALKMRHAPSPV